MKKNIHRGSEFRDFLEEDGILEEVEELAIKKALALQLERLIAENHITKVEMAARMRTSRAAVDRLLDASKASLTISTLGRAARALGRTVRIELVPE